MHSSGWVKVLLVEVFTFLIFTYYIRIVYDRNHLFGLGSDTKTETENWPKLSADTETNQSQKNLLLESIISRGLQKFLMSCQLPKHLFSISLILSCQSVITQLEKISSDVAA